MEIIRKRNGIEINFEDKDTVAERRLANTKCDEIIILLNLIGERK